MIVEFNSDDLTRYRKQYSLALYLYHRFTRKRVLRAASGFNHVPHELAERYESFGIPQITIPNGIQLDRFEPLKPAATERTTQFFIGSPSAKWHGEASIFDIARENPDWDFHIVGRTDDEMRFRERTDAATVLRVSQSKLVR
ncbi:MAG: hypothetical protein AAFV88_15830 [Planctomycetota bacterium]